MGRKRYIKAVMRKHVDVDEMKMVAEMFAWL